MPNTEDKSHYIDPGITKLIEERGLPSNSYALFFCTITDRFVPKLNGDAYEKSDGFVVTRQARHFSFGTTWNLKTNREVLDEWLEVSMDPEWLLNPEYRRALMRVDQFCEPAYQFVLKRQQSLGT